MNSETNEQRKLRITKQVSNAAALLQKHVDSVQIFVTFQAEDGETTSAFEYGLGNFYARQGQVDEWLRIQHEFQRVFARRKDEKEQDE